jgi:hypothetical protein
VNYYWANPSLVITSATATPIGTSFVSLLAGETKDVLCVTPWIPTWVNNGHECLIAEAFHASDPLPPRGANDPFDPQAIRNSAQLNLGVALAMANQLAVYSFATANAARFHSAQVTLRARRAPIKMLAKIQANLGLMKLPEELGDSEEFGLQPYRCGEQVESVGKPELTLHLEVGEQRAMALVVRFPERRRGVSALYFIEQIVHDKVVGGVAALVVAKADEVHPPQKKE